MKSTTRSLGLIGLLGGLGGAINAWLCYAKMPVPVNDDPSFAWHVIPSGALHGVVLTLIPIGCARILQKKRLLIKLLFAPCVGWFSGFVSWLPLGASLKLPMYEFSFEWLWWPYAYFGFVGLLLYVLLVFLTGCEQVRKDHLLLCLLIGIVSGSLGSLWWWSGWRPWYFSLIHGTIWGSLVG